MVEGDPSLGFLSEAVNGLTEAGGVVLGPGGKKAGGQAALKLPRLSSSEEVQIQRAKKYAMEQSIKIVLMRQTMAHQQAQAKSVQRQQAIVLMCRIYVGSINFEVREETLKTTFGPFGPIKAISMSWDPISQKHKGFAFVDFETPEAAQLALEQMNGTLVSGRNIKVGRPSNMPQAQSIIEDIEREAKDYFRLYIGGIHKDLAKEDIKSVFEAFGNVKSCELVPSVDGKHRGYGFLEYETLQSCMDAINSMNQFDLGGQYLRVGRAITPPDLKNTGSMDAKASVIPNASALAAAAVTAKIQALDAVAENLGVDAQNIHDQERVKQQKRDKERQEDREKRAKEREREREREREQRERRRGGGRDRDRDSRDRDDKKSRVKSEPEPPKEEAKPPPPPPQDGSVAIPVPPSTLPSGEQRGGLVNPLDRNAGTQGAIEAAQQVELQKKLLEDNEAITLSQQENMQIKGQSARHLVMQKLMGAHGGLRESKVVCLRNMVGHEDVDESLQDEIEDECSKFGDVDNVIIYQERQSEEADAEIIVKIFVEFQNPLGAKAAKDSLNGRFFGGRHVRADIYDQVMYEEQDFSH